MTNLMTQPYFPNFVPNQILTNVQLNELRQFLDEQNRLTRTRLIGTGIVCGLNPAFDELPNGNIAITISEGYGISSEGFLIEIPEKVLVHARQYKDPYQEPIDEAVLPGNNGTLWPVYEPWRLPVGNIDLTQPDPVTQIPMLELLTQSELDDPAFVQEAGNISVPITKANLKDKVLVLYLEMDPQNLKSCLTTDCNNKGQNLHFYVRVLLIERQYLQPVELCTPEYDPIQAPRLHVGLHRLFSIGLGGVTAVAEINDAYSDISRFIKDILVPKVQGLYNNWNAFLGLHELKSYVDTLGSRLTTILNTQSANQYHYDFFKDLAQACNEFTLLLCELIKDCCITGNFPRHLMLGEFVGICLDWDAGNDGALMEATLTQSGNQALLSNHIRTTAAQLQTANGLLPFGFGKLDNTFFNFGSGKIWRFGNMSVVFDFTQTAEPVETISFDFYHAGGTDNISVNGHTLFIGKIFNAPANIAPNITLSAVFGPSPQNPVNTVGKITLTGPVQRILIGGQELWIDNLCTGGTILYTDGAYRNHFMPSPVRNVMHKDLDRARKLFRRVIDLSRYFSIPAQAVIKITPSQTEVFELGKRAVPYYYQEAVRPNWPPMMCCTPPALSYAGNTMHSPANSQYMDYLPNPLHYSILPHTFYRIEGHLNQPCTNVLNSLRNLRELHNLEFALRVLHTNGIYNTPDNSQIQIVWNGITEIWRQINLNADSGNYDAAQYKILRAAIVKQTAELSDRNNAWIQERKQTQPPCDLTALQSDYLQIRAELFCLIHKIRPIREQLPDSSQPSEPVEACVTFESLSTGQMFGGNFNQPGDQILVENEIVVTVENFRQSTGAVSFNLARVEADGGSKHISHNNINFRYNFEHLDFVPTEVTFLIRDMGGIENIAVNDNPVVIGSILQGFGGQVIAPGITFNFVPAGPNTPTIGVCTLKGNIKSFMVGGQEFLIDQVCAKGQTVATPGMDEPPFRVRFNQLEYLTSLLDNLTRKDLLCLNYPLFSGVLKQLIGTAIEIRLHLSLFYQQSGAGFNAYQYYPVWQDLEHCLSHLHYNCLLPRFANLYYLLEYLLGESAYVFRNFAKAHPGLEHQAGVPKGGTFILLCEENANAAEVVVADFALEQCLDVCCCHLNVNDLCLPPVALPDYRIAGNAAVLTIDVIGNDFGQNDLSGLEIVLPASTSDRGGALTLSGSAGPVTYLPPAGQTGIDHFVYRLIDRACDQAEDLGHVYILLGQVVSPCPFPVTESPAQLREIAPWSKEPLFTVGESIAGYLPPGLLDGIGALRRSANTVRFYLSHNIRTGLSYPYQLANGVQLGGARISYIDYDLSTKCFSKAGLAYKAIYDRNGAPVTAPAQLENGSLVFFSSGVLYRAGQYGFKDDIYFTGEAPGGGNKTAFALDLKMEELHAVPFLGRAAWKNVAAIDTGDAKFIALLIGDNRPGGRLLLYVGEVGSASASLLARNGLAKGRLFVWVATQGGQNPSQFAGTGSVRKGRFVEIAYYNPAQAGTNGYDSAGFATQARQDDLYNKLEAFAFSRPADLATNPQNGRQVVFASTGGDNTDHWGMVYRIDLSFNNIAGGAIMADLTILYDANDMGKGQFNNPDQGLRNPDNLHWASNNLIYVQENPLFQEFGLISGLETSVWELNPVNGIVRRIAITDRSGIPSGQSDSEAGVIGRWPSSGILDVSGIFDVPDKEVLLACNVQAHSLKGGVINSANLLEGGQLLLLRKQPTVIDPNLVVADLQIVHNLKDVKVDLYVDNELLIRDFTAYAASPFISIPADKEIMVGIAPLNSQSAADVVQKIPLTLKANTAGIVVIGAQPDNPAAAALNLTDKVSTEAGTANDVSLSFLHDAPDTPALSLSANGAVWFKGVKPGQFVEPLTVPAGIYRIAVTPAKVNADPDDTYLADLSFMKGYAALIFASGSPKTGNFGLWVSMSNGGVFPLPLIKKDTPEGPKQVLIKLPKTNSDGRISFDEMTVKFETRSTVVRPVRRSPVKKSKKT